MPVRSPVTDDMYDPSVVRAYLERWAGDDVAWIRRLPGHSGITYGFRVAADDLVVKLRPAGVKANAGNDIAGQGRMLAALGARGLQVPGVRAVGDEGDGPFPVPYVITEMVRGRMLGDACDPSAPPDASPSEIETCFREAIGELRRIHAVPVDELERVFRTAPGRRGGALAAGAAQGEDPEWVETGARLHDRLLDSVPSDVPLGVSHGDFHANNWLFDGCSLGGRPGLGELRARPDGGRPRLALHDLRPPELGPSRQPLLAPFPSPDLMVSEYGPVQRLNWFRALAAFKLGSLTAHFLRLHRTGRRPDPTWEGFGEAVGSLIGRAHSLLDDDG